MNGGWISTTFEVPTTIDHEYFHICPLSSEVARIDYEAVMSSHDSLRGIFGPNTLWPSADMTYAQNLASIKVHEQEFVAKEAFVFAVLDVSKRRCLGSVYIDPSSSKHYDCEVHYWLRDDCKDMEDHLYQLVSSWLRRDWPFTTVAYPGRVIPWRDWMLEI